MQAPDNSIAWWHGLSWYISHQFLSTAWIQFGETAQHLGPNAGWNRTKKLRKWKLKDGTIRSRFQMDRETALGTAWLCSSGRHLPTSDLHSPLSNCLMQQVLMMTLIRHFIFHDTGAEIISRWKIPCIIQRLSYLSHYLQVFFYAAAARCRARIGGSTAPNQSYTCMRPEGEVLSL